MMLRANRRLRRVLGSAGVDFIEYAAGAIQRILPHVEITGWDDVPWEETESVWVNKKRKQIRITLAVGEKDIADAGSLTTVVRRRSVAVARQVAGQTLDMREFDICKRIAMRIAEVVRGTPSETSRATMRAIRDSFEEDIVAEHIKDHQHSNYHSLEMSVSDLFVHLHRLSEQTYENRSLSFGCVIDSGKRGGSAGAQFPEEFLEAKKFKALSDGFRTVYYVSTDGRVLDFLDLEAAKEKPLTAQNYFPDWAEPLARVSRGGRYGVALSRQGDILVFDGGTLRFTHRHGRWQYWNHGHILNLLCDRAKAQKATPRVVNSVVGAAYVGALDVSFRRSGGLFILLHNRRNLHQIVRKGDAIGDRGKKLMDQDFDAVLTKRKFQSLPPSVVVELAALDGAIVLSNDGDILAYGAILRPSKTGRLRAAEGSRTKAAIGASHFGLAIKISSDGDIDVFHKGKEFISVSQTG